MRVLITGICGFVGSTLARGLREHDGLLEIVGIDNFGRPGSYLNQEPLQQCGVKVLHADMRMPSDFETLPRVDWIIDAAANASVLAGVEGETNSRQLVEHNLYGTHNVLELAKRDGAGCILLSTSRVYSIRRLAELPVEVKDEAYRPIDSRELPTGVSAGGIAETFSTEAPVSLYGSSKLASECLALEYGAAFNFPVWINRCGVMAGAGQFGRADQGIFSFWINSYLRRRPLRYIGFDGHGFQTRDCFHPRDLVPLLLQQIGAGSSNRVRTVNLGGGLANTMSLARLSGWCADRFGLHEIASDPRPRPFDLPWLVMDSSLASQTWGWKATTSLPSILEEIAHHAEQNPRWLEVSSPP